MFIYCINVFDTTAAAKMAVVNDKQAIGYTVFLFGATAS